MVDIKYWIFEIYNGSIIYKPLFFMNIVSFYREKRSRGRFAYIYNCGHARFWTNNREHVIGKWGHYEPITTRILMEAARDGAVILDVGAHIGVHTVHMALVGGRVIAVEPDRFNLSLLLANLQLNKVNARVIPAAACAKSGKTMLYRSASSASHSLSAEWAERRGGGVLGHTEVPCIALDEVVDSVDVIKIDVEGAEFEVLRGAQELLKQAGMVIIETTPDSPSVKLLRKHNFKLSRVADTWDPEAKLANLVFIRA